jgi:hypothetical protein
VFGSVVVVVFQSIFYSEKYANNIFLFFKIIFDISTLKLFENIKNILIQSKKKIQIFSEVLSKRTKRPLFFIYIYKRVK